MVTYKKNLNFEGEVQNTLPYINFNNIVKGKAPINAKKMFFVPFTTNKIPKKEFFWPFFVPYAK